MPSKNSDVETNDESYSSNRSDENTHDKGKESQSQSVSKGHDNDSYANYTDESISDSEIDNDAEALQVSKEFQENVIKYVKLHDLIQKRNDEIRELKKQKKPCEEYILKYLDQVDVGHVDITDGKLRRNKSENKVPLSQDIIRGAIGKKITDPAIINEIIKSIENRPTKTQTNIKRTKNRNDQKIIKK